MRTKTFFNYVVAALFCCCVTGMGYIVPEPDGYWVS